MTKKINTEIFITKAKKVHGDKYDYSKVNYIDTLTKVCIICPQHGEFWQTPSNHVHKTHPRGCPKCNGGLKSSDNEFIRKAKEIHGDKYDYSKVEYVNANTKVCIICPKHGEFLQTPNAHLHSQGCPKCWEERKGKSLFSNTNDFVQKSKLIYGDRYDYSKVIYERSNKKVCIICPIHGEFWKTPCHHLSGQGCPECSKIENSKRNSVTTSEFIKRAKKVHGDKYDYSKVDLEHRDERGRVCIICPTHGEFWQTPHNHLNKRGCELCIRPIHDTDSFIQTVKKIHGNKYDYSKVKYVNSNTKVKVVCPKHGEFEVLPGSHIHAKHGCPKCNRSHLEEEMVKFLELENIEYENEKKFKWLEKQELDFYLPKYNIAIECQGIQHFEERTFFEDSLEVIKERDERKRRLCEENGVKILYYSNLGIKYPYEVFENKTDLLNEIKRFG